MAQGKRRVQISEKLLQELLDSCYGLLVSRYQAEDVKEFSGTTDPVLKQAHRVLNAARKRGFAPTGYEQATEHLLDMPLRLRRQPAHTPVIETVRNLPDRTVNRLIEQHFEVEGYDCAADWDSDHIECVTVSLKQYDRKARRRVGRWRVEDYSEEPSLEELLCELARCGILPEGNYEIWIK